MKKVIIDVDTGIDDALAILLAAKSKKLDILGITTVAGNTNLDNATINTLKVLKLIDKTIPVYKGASKPLLRDINFKRGVHGENGMAGALKDIDYGKEEDKHAVDFIIDSCLNNKDITIILVGPMTNMALALKRKPEIAKNIKEIITMGGAYNGKGNESLVSEFNVYTDPESAKIVYNSNVDVKMVGLDVTRKAMLMEDDLKRLNKNKVTNFVKKVSNHYIDRYFKNTNIKGCALHDPLAVALALDDSLVQTKDTFVDVEIKSKYCDGLTICDFKNTLDKKANTEVCVDVDSKRFIDMFIDTLNK
ncbi:MAG: nucleoside hydrolase [Firmicutes bacterium]|nr:nucleoside hydrolase [Bacillota bacterium]